MNYCVHLATLKKNFMRCQMSSEKQLILIILTAVVVFGYQYYKDEKKKHDEKLQRHLSKYFDSKW